MKMNRSINRAAFLCMCCALTAHALDLPWEKSAAPPANTNSQPVAPIATPAGGEAVSVLPQSATSATRVDLGKIWTVVEVGEGTEYNGTWTRQGDGNTFVANWRRKDGRILATGEISVESITENRIILFRKGFGRYLGTIAADGRHISGTRSWNQGTWAASIESHPATSR